MIEDIEWFSEFPRKEESSEGRGGRREKEERRYPRVGWGWFVAECSTRTDIQTEKEKENPLSRKAKQKKGEIITAHTVGYLIAANENKTEDALNEITAWGHTYSHPRVYDQGTWI